jgi:hypothetical protein
MSKVDSIREKYPRIRESSFNLFNEADKTPTKKYLERMCYYWNNKGTNKLYSKELINTVMNFDKLLPYIKNKDIYDKYYDNFQVLSAIVHNAEQIKFDKEFVREGNVDVIYETDRYLALRPLTYKGSLKYGASTRWCTASRTNEQTFKQYTRNNHLIYVIDKKNDNAKANKMAILIQKNQDLEVFFSPTMDLFNPEDLAVGIHWFVDKGWDEDELIKIITNVRFDYYKTGKVDKIKSDVSSTMNSIKNIDLEKLMKNIEKLKNLDLVTGETQENNKKIIDDFVSKIVKLNVEIN